MKTFNYERIGQEVRTVDDLRYFSSRIDLLLVNLFQTNPTAFADTLKEKLPGDLSTLLDESLRDQQVALSERETLQHFFHGLKDYLTHLPVLQLTLAYHPTGEQAGKLSDWARQKTAKNVVLDFRYDPRVLGGAIVTYGGKYVDLSLKKRLDSVYEAKKPEILAMLK